jgi:retron-type reverse transcriptase
MIEGDISKCFDTIDHNIVRKCLSRTIDDERFVSLIIRSLRSKVLMPKGALENSRMNIGQGGVCSPLLSNIVLHQLDRLVSRLKRRIDRGRFRRRNPEYVSLMNHSRYYKATKAGKAAMATVPKITPVLTNDPEYRRMHYARYADNFIIGITGPLTLAVRVKMLVARFLKQRLCLQLNEDKTVITQLSKNDVPFLGYSIRRRQLFAMRHTQHFGNYTRRIRQIRIGGITLLADIDKVVQGLAYKGFCKGRYPVPNFRYMHQPQSYTITKANSILRRLNEYYRLSENRRAAVSYFSYLVRYSLAKMFAAKYKLRSVAHVFKKAGKDLGRSLKSKVSTHGPSENQLVKAAKSAGSVVKGTMPKLLYTKYKDIQKPDLSFRLDSGIRGMRGNKMDRI